MNRTGNRQSGIAIGPILFVVAILAALASAIATGSGAFNSDTSAVSAKAMASSILEYTQDIQLGVDRLIAKGCSDTQLNFGAPIVVYGDSVNNTLKNPNAPLDKSCDVFSVEGGGIVFKLPAPSMNDTNSNTIVDSRRVIDWWPRGVIPYSFTGSISIENFGTEERDLILILPIKQQSLCEELNRLLGVQTIQTVIVYWMGGGSIYFGGYYDTVGNPYPAYYHGYPAGIRSGCAKTYSWPFLVEQHYVFYRLLLAR